MKAILAEVPQYILEWRKKTGADQWDEMWEGVLHMPPMASRGHMYMEWCLETWLQYNWGRPEGNKVYHEVNLASVGGWPGDYVIPDLLLLTPPRFHTDKDAYFEGAPDTVVEIKSPNDESYDKLKWYARVGVPEVWIIDRDTKTPELHGLSNGVYQAQKPDEQGWLTSVLGIQLRSQTTGRLQIRLASSPDAIAELPD